MKTQGNSRWLENYEEITSATTTPPTLFLKREGDLIKNGEKRIK